VGSCRKYTVGRHPLWVGHSVTDNPRGRTGTLCPTTNATSFPVSETPAHRWVGHSVTGRGRREPAAYQNRKNTFFWMNPSTS